MNCDFCGYRYTDLGCCLTEGFPVRHCPACGTIRTCDGVVLTPAWSHARGKPLARAEEPDAALSGVSALRE